MHAENSILSKIQTELAVAKSRKNQFGKFNYRNTADICEAIKPLLVKYECHLIMNDELVVVGDRYYVKSTSKLYTKNEYGGLIGTATAWAREPSEKKGMDSPQVTVTTSSYARKQSLCGLLAIDENDTIDRDSHAPTVAIKKPAKSEVNKLKSVLSDDKARIEAMLDYFNVKDISELTKSQIDEALKLVG